MAPRTRSAARAAPNRDMCQTSPGRGADAVSESDTSLLLQAMESLQREIRELRELYTIRVDASWLIPESEQAEEDLDALLEDDDSPVESEPLSRLPPAPKFPQPRDSAFKLSTLPMWLSSFRLAATTVLHQLRGTAASKRATFAYWMAQVNSEINHPELHKILHTPSLSVSTVIAEIKNAFGYSQERYERSVRQRLMNLDFGEHELVRPLWQRFKTAYREAVRLNLVSSGDKTELLEKVREICATCPALQERVGNLLRMRTVTAQGSVYEPQDPIDFDRIASIVDYAIESLEEERGKSLRRDNRAKPLGGERKREELRGKTQYSTPQPPPNNKRGPPPARPDNRPPPHDERADRQGLDVRRNFPQQPAKRNYEGDAPIIQKARRVLEESSNL